ncbi:transposase [Streptomyces fradiae]|uniref:transposase n=1 Tax=Streptomyces fradiae TaxID=1906 RepID=UPI00369185BF
MSVRPGAAGGVCRVVRRLLHAYRPAKRFRTFLTGLLAPLNRNKTLTCLAGAEPVTEAGRPQVQRLQFFLSGSRCNAEKVNEVPLGLLLSDRHTAPPAHGVLVVDDSGDRKDGTVTAFTGRQWLGRLGKTDNGIVTVTTLWADERLYYPLHALPCSPPTISPRSAATRASAPSRSWPPRQPSWPRGPASRICGSPRVRSPRATRLGDRWLSACTRVDEPGELLGIFGEEFP